METVWRKCSSCKNPIALGARYYVCSVSTCNSPRTGYVFCSVPCWEVHLPSARHKDAAAIEQFAPRTVTTPPDGTRRVVAASTPAAKIGAAPAPREVLIIASRLKDYVQARADMNTGGAVIDVLSDFVRAACDRAIENARADGRKTVLDRDFGFLGRGVARTMRAGQNASPSIPKAT